MRLIRQFLFAIVIGQYMFSGTGCSAIGLGIGAASDSNNKTSRQEFPGEELTRIPINSQIQIFLKNGQLQEGKFQFYMERRTGVEYAGYIVWYDKATDRQVSTKIADIERIVRIVAKQQQNGKWIGLGIGVLIDAIILNSYDPFPDGFF